jgi:hypothetical protein
MLTFKPLSNILVGSGSYIGLKATTISIMWQIVSGVAVLHGNGVIHRDLKPDNIVFHRNDKDQLMIKIIDYGCSIRGSSITRETPMCGSPQFICLFLFAMHLFLTYSDIWYAFVVLFFFITLVKFAGAGSSDDDVIHKQ